MAFHLRPLQPPWSFVATAGQPLPVPVPAFDVKLEPDIRLGVPVQGWRAGADGRPRLRWTVERAA